MSALPLRLFSCLTLLEFSKLCRFRSLTFPCHCHKYFSYNTNRLAVSLSRHNRSYITSYVHNSASSFRTCWSCSRLVKDLSFFCECGKVQPVSPNWSYFNVLGYPNPEPVIDVIDLGDRMRQTQKLLHPDKFSAKTQYEKDLASDASAYINKAYSCLQKPVERYEYLLHLHGVSTDNVDFKKSDDTEFLSEVMNIREKVEEVIRDVLSPSRSEKSLSELYGTVRELVSELRQRLNDEEKIIINLISKSDWTGALISLSRFKYILKVFEELREYEFAWKQLGINVTTT
ncbi:unnamed protein product [Schistosoma mattheei]|uniref:HSCB_C domain-containing protein n=1 Tax=Schistosoma mattheei TaxID=31246 RepID=A0AA85BF57_9TREM|nr:unnamed protein product [Schistosoma mattheei]